MKYIVREYRGEDLTAVAKLISMTFRECNFQDNEPEAARAYARFFNPELNNITEIENVFSRATLHFVAVHDSRIIGAIRGTDHRISSLFVDPEYHGRNVGRQLVSKFEEKSAAKIIEMNSQVAAIPFYQKMGYIPEGTVTTSGGLRVQLMKKKRSRLTREM